MSHSCGMAAHGAPQIARGMDRVDDEVTSTMSSSDSEDELDHDDEHTLEEVELGFVSKIQLPVDATLLHENSNWDEWDGGLVGGKPRWLTPDTVPSTDALKCAACSTPLSFLLQIYCPLDDIEDAFHRSLYLFCCRNSPCDAQGSGKVFRAQLPKVNKYYPEQGNVEYFTSTTTSASQCALCGQRAVFTCNACKVAQYCSKVHQKDHWSHGHKADCSKCVENGKLVESKSSREALRNNGSKWVFPQYEIEIEHEPDATQAANEHEAKLIADFENKTALGDARDKCADKEDPFADDADFTISQKDLNEALGATAQQDKMYICFLTRVELAKDQVLRYARWQENSVLWVHEKSTIERDAVPPCAQCGGQRKFEFQVLPQLLFYLHVDQQSSLGDISEKSCEWGTLAVYTCAQSCTLNGQFSEEFVHYQTPYAGE